MEQNITELIESKINDYNSEFNTADDIVVYKGYNVIFTKPTLFENEDYGKFSKKNKNLHIIMNYEVPKEFRFKSIRQTRTFIGKDVPVDNICGRKFIYVCKKPGTKIKFIDCNVFAFINSYNSKDIIFDNCYIKLYSDYNRRRYLERILFNNCTITTKPGITIQFSSCIFNNCIFTRVKAEMIEFSYRSSIDNSGDSIINNCTIDKYCKSAILVPYTSDIITSRLNLINNFIIYITNIKFIYCIDSDDLKNYLTSGKIILKGTRKMLCPQKGSFTGYKFAISTRALERIDLLLHKIIYGDVPGYDFQSRFNEIIREYGVILELNIPDDAKRSSGFFNKCRCSKATVISAAALNNKLSSMITREDSEFISLFELGEEIRSFMTKKNTILYTINSYQKDSYPIVLDKSKLKTRYKMGEEISIDNFDNCRFITCSSGIHFYMSYKEVIKYLTNEVLKK